MAAADRVELRIEPLADAVQGRPQPPGTAAVANRCCASRPAPTRGNWVFGESGGEPLTFRRLWIDDGRLRFIDAPGKTDIDFQVESREPESGNAAAPIAIDGGGRWSGNRFTLEGTRRIAARTAATPTSRTASTCAPRPAPRARMHAARWSIRFRLRDFDLRLALSGQNLEDLYPLIGIATPPTPPYTLDGRFTRDGDTWHYDGFTGKVGDSDLGGSASVATGGERPFLRAEPGVEATGFRRPRRLRRRRAEGGRQRDQQRRTARHWPRSRPQARACCPTRRTNWRSCARWTPTCAGRRSGSTPPVCRSTTWMRI